MSHLPVTDPPRFDPNAAAQFDGPYGLPYTVEQAAAVLVPVPFEATTSYGGGTKDGPRAIFEASLQVDLFDLDLGRPYEPGIAALEEPAEVRAWNDEARAIGQPVIDAGGAGDDAELLARVKQVDDFGARVNAWVHAATTKVLDAGKLPVIVGGDHSTPFGAIQAVAERFPGVGVLHVDAHADLRNAYEGFTWSHASIMFNVAERVPQVAKIVQVGIRDFCEEEFDYVQASNGRVVTHFDASLARERMRGATWLSQVERIVAALPQDVYVSFDIDGLDPVLCPDTGTPVAGGLQFHEAVELVAAVARSGRRIVGLDLNEVAPGEDDGEWNGNVGARLLYKMVGWAFASRGLLVPRAW